MLQEFIDIMDSHISPKLSECFEDIPDVKCLVKEMPFDGPGGMYYPASADGNVSIIVQYTQYPQAICYLIFVSSYYTSFARFLRVAKINVAKFNACI